jgi:hypothetical protein
MATRSAPVICKENHVKASKPHVLRFYQHFSFHESHDKVLEGQTFWTEFAFSSRAALDKAVAKPEAMIEECRQELLINAAQMQQKGFVLNDLVISFDGIRGFEVEALDARHIRMALRKHDAWKPDAKPEKRLKNAWKVSQDERFPEIVAQGFQEYMQNLRPRSDHLSSLAWREEDVMVEEFSKVAPIWSMHEKGYYRLENFFYRLISAKKFEAHRQCLSIWSELVHAKPERFFKSFDIVAMTHEGEEAGVNNPLIGSGDAFALINTYLALDPAECLAEGTNLLSGTWRASLGDPALRDAAVAALMSGYARHQRLGSRMGGRMDGFGGQTSPDTVSKVFFNRVAASAGIDFQGLLDEMAPFGEQTSPTVGRYYSHEVNYMQDTGRYDLKIPSAITRLMPIAHCEEIFSLALKARLLSTKAHEVYVSNRYKLDQDEAYYNKVITNPNTSLSQILVAVHAPFMHASNFVQLAQSIHGKAFVERMSEEVRTEHISKGRIPPSLLSRESDIANALEVDLGL